MRILLKFISKRKQLTVFITFFCNSMILAIFFPHNWLMILCHSCAQLTELTIYFPQIVNKMWDFFLVIDWQNSQLFLWSIDELHWFIYLMSELWNFADTSRSFNENCDFISGLFDENWIFISGSFDEHYTFISGSFAENCTFISESFAENCTFISGFFNENHSFVLWLFGKMTAWYHISLTKMTFIHHCQKSQVDIVIIWRISWFDFQILDKK